MSEGAKHTLDGASDPSAKRTKTGKSRLGKYIIQGEVIVRGEPEYDDARYQYATSGKFSETSPAAIVKVVKDEDDSDIKAVIDYAKENDLAISVRSGGHQYLGFSSTTGNNIQLDMSNYNDWDESEVPKDKGSKLVMGPSWKLYQIHDKCQRLQIFFPHGECAGVGAGGHCQTGGYSIFSYSFGMFIDHILWFDIMTADKQVRRIHRPDTANPDADNDDLWFCALGGSPGNYGIVLRFQVQIIHNDEYPTARAFFRFLPMNRDIIQNLMNIFDTTNDDKELPASIQYSVMMLSKGCLHRYEFELDGHGQAGSDADKIYDALAAMFPNLFRNHMLPPVVVAIGINTGVDKTPSGIEKADQWFSDVKQQVWEIENDMSYYPSILARLAFSVLNLLMGVDGNTPVPLSELDHKCSWRFDREFKLPFQKRVYNGSDRNLAGRGFADWATEKCWQLESLNQTDGPDSGLRLAMQAVTGGSVGSKHAPSDFPTALGHRSADANMFTIDFFYRTKDDGGNDWNEPFENGTKWLDTDVDAVSRHATGPNGKFSGPEYRYLYAPWGPRSEPWSNDVRLDSAEMIYYFYDSVDVYNRLLSTKLRFDPDHTFTPNCFCVGYSSMSAELKAKRETLAATAAPITAPAAGAKEESDAALLTMTELENRYIKQKVVITEEIRKLYNQLDSATDFAAMDTGF